MARSRVTKPMVGLSLRMACRTAWFHCRTTSAESRQRGSGGPTLQWRGRVCGVWGPQGEGRVRGGGGGGGGGEKKGGGRPGLFPNRRLWPRPHDDGRARRHVGDRDP